MTITLETPEEQPDTLTYQSPDKRIVLKYPESDCVVVFDPNAEHPGGSSTVPFYIDNHPTPEEFQQIAIKALNTTTYGKYDSIPI